MTHVMSIFVSGGKHFEFNWVDKSGINIPTNGGKRGHIMSRGVNGTKSWKIVEYVMRRINNKNCQWGVSIGYLYL